MTTRPSKWLHNEKHGTWVSPAGIITFAAVAKKWKDKEKEDDDGQFAVTLILPPGLDHTGVQKAVQDEWKAKKLGGDKPPKTPFLRAEEKLGEDRMPDGFDPKGWLMIRANTYTQRPGVIFASGETVPVEELIEEVYNGRWARISIKPHAYNQKGNKGVKFYLNNIQLLDAGDKWPTSSSRVAASEDFEAVNIEAGKGQSADSVFD